jgi:hypothetical protein
MTQHKIIKYAFILYSLYIWLFGLKAAMLIVKSWGKTRHFKDINRFFDINETLQE